MLTNPYADNPKIGRMIYLYLIEEKSICQIGQEMNCSRQWVQFVLKAANVPIRPKKRPPKPTIKTELQWRKEAEKELGFRRCSKCKLLNRIGEDFYRGGHSQCKQCSDKLAIIHQRKKRKAQQETETP